MATAMSGQITVSTAGTAVQGPSVAGDGFFIKVLSTAPGVGYVGNDGAGDVASGTGHELSPDQYIVSDVKNLSELWFDSAEDSTVFTWFRLKGGID